jgi:hypothetical protein
MPTLRFICFCLFYAISITFIHGQVTAFKIDYYEPIVTKHGNSSLQFTEDLSIFSNYPDDPSVETRIILFWDTTLNHNAANFQNASRLIQKFLVGKQTNEKTAVYLFQITNDIFWKDLIPPIGADQKSNARVKPGKLATHLSALVLSNSEDQLKEREKHFSKSKKATQEHTLRYYTSEDLKRKFLFMEKERYGSSCLLNEDSLLITSLALMWDKELVIQRSANDRDAKIDNLSDDLEKLSIEYKSLRDSLESEHPKLPYCVKLVNAIHLNSTTRFQLPDDQEIRFKGFIYSSGLALGYNWRNYRLNLGLNAFTGGIQSIGGIDWSVSTEQNGYNQIARIKSYKELISFRGLESTITLDWWPSTKFKRWSLFSGLSISTLSSTYYVASADEWSIARRYPDYEQEVTNIPDLGLFNDSSVYNVGSIEYKTAFYIPFGVSYEYAVSKRWFIGGFISRNLAMRNWKTDPRERAPYSSVDDFGSVAQWYDLMPIFPWKLGAAITYNL